MRGKQLVTIDFETYYNKKKDPERGDKYTLGTGGLPTSLYVQDDRFRTLTMSFKTPQMPRARCLIGPAQVQAFFDRLKQSNRDIILCGHNLQFDGYIASFHYGFVPYMYLCTQSLARPLYAVYHDLSLETLAVKLGIDDDGKEKGVLDQWNGVTWEQATPAMRRSMAIYNNKDVELTEKLLFKLYPQIPAAERWLQDLTIRMFCDPIVEVDEESARAIYDEQKRVKAEAAANVGVDEAVLRSNDKFAALLEERGYEVPKKYSPKQKKTIPAVAQGDVPYQRLVRGGDVALRKLAHARKTVKSTNVEAKAKALLARAGNPMPIGLVYCGAHTLRWSGTDKLNPQNLNREGGLRECLTAPPGYKFVIADAAQIEARITAYVSGQRDVVEAFRRKEDVYAVEASGIYKFEVNKNDHPQERFVGKTAVLGLGFQCGAEKYRTMLEAGAFGPPVFLEEHEAEHIVASFRARRPYIKATWYDLQEHIPLFMGGTQRVWRDIAIFKPGGELLLPNDMHLHYPDMFTQPGKYGPEYMYMRYDYKSKRAEPHKLYGGLLLENIVQSLARSATAGHALQLMNRWRIVLLVHDEIVMCVPEDDAEQCLTETLQVMSHTPRWLGDCPLEGEGKIVDHYVK